MSELLSPQEKMMVQGRIDMINMITTGVGTKNLLDPSVWEIAYGQDSSSAKIAQEMFNFLTTKCTPSELLELIARSDDPLKRAMIPKDGTSQARTALGIVFTFSQLEIKYAMEKFGTSYNLYQRFSSKK